MIDIIIWLLVGAFIGWNIPQPGWAIIGQAWIMNKLSGFSSNKNEPVKKKTTRGKK
jgi:hypothetical protein|tara:strand:- start:271 stop:438 length:168 start_codon:yes stop_codon:yes gene_type:complete